MMFLSAILYLLIGFLIANGLHQFQTGDQTYKNTFETFLTITCWPFTLATMFIEVVDEVKRNRGI